MKNLKSIIALLVLTVFSVNAWGAEAVGTFTKVTDASTLAANDEIIIVADAANFALSTTQNSNNRGQAEVTKSNNEITLSSESSVQLLTLSVKNSHFEFNTGDGYLYAASSSNNQLKTQATNNANGEWTISISDGVATITAQGSNSRKVMQYNSSSSCFSCYSSASQSALTIYKKAPSCTNPTTPLSITSVATVKTGKTITLASDGGNGGTVKWSVENGTGTASISNGILTAGNVGTVTVKAHQDQNGTTCETDAEQTVNITAITYNDYITECSSDPSISVSTAELSGFTYIYSQGPSAAQTVMVNGFYLQNNVTVTASDNYEICLSQDGTYTSTINLTPVDQMVNTPVYVRLKAGKEVNNSYDGTLTIASNGLDDLTVNLSGSVVAPITVTLMDDNTELQQLTFGGSVNLPSRTTSCEGFTFVGWSETHVTAETAVKPTTINAGDYVPTTNIELWPVFSKGDLTPTNNYLQITSASQFESGAKYLITRGSNIALNGASFYDDNSFGTSTVTANASTITTTDENLIWTIRGDNSTGYSIYTAYDGGGYIAYDYDEEHLGYYNGSAVDDSNMRDMDISFDPSAGYKVYITIRSLSTTTYFAGQSYYGTIYFEASTTSGYVNLYKQQTVGSSVYISTPECYETTITLDKGTNGQTDGSVTAAKGSATLSDYTAAVGPEHYHLLGYYDGDTKVIDANGQLVANAGSYTDANAKWQKQDATLTLTAQWEINTHSLTWTTDGDDLTGDYTHGDAVAYGTSIVQPNTPTKTGYTFKDWTTEVPATMPDDDLSFTATWTINQYRVTWSINGDESQYADFDYNSALVLPTTDPESCDGEKVFVGWTKDPISEETDDAPADLFTTAGDKKVTANTTFYAVFADASEGGTTSVTKDIIAEVGLNSSVTLNTDNNPYQMGELPITLTGAKGTNNYPALNYNATSGTDLRFYNGTACAVTFATTNDQPITKIEFKKNSTTNSNLGTSFSANVGTLSGNVWTGSATSVTFTYSANSTFKEQMYIINVTYSEAGGTSYSNYITSCFVPTYSVTIQSNNTTMGTAAINPEHIKDVYEQGDELEVNATVTESELYRFVNWTIEPATTGASLYMGANEAENLLTVGSGNITLTANFEAIPADPITVTLEVGEHGTLDCEDCVNNTITEGTAGEGVLVPNVNANEGWAFLGWSTSSTATEPEYEVADIFYPSDDNKTLYAVYAQLYKVTLKYTDEVKWQTTAGGAIALPSRDCKNETYKGHFAGWSITEFAEETTNPTETPTIYPVGDFVPTADITLYPIFSITAETTQWKKVAASAISETGVYALLGDNNYPFNGKISDGKGQQTDNAFEFVNNVATSAPEGTCELTMTFNSSKCSMYNTDKGYLYPKDNTSGNLAWSTTVYDQWTYYSNQSTWEYKLSSNKYAHLRSNNSQFNTYSSTSYGTLISFAKKETISVGKYWSKPANDVTNPKLDLAAGDYLAPQTIKITAATYQSDYAYRYTTDGSAPSKSSTVYDHNTGIQLEIANNYTVKVIGYDEDNYETQVAEETYALYPVFNSISDMYAGATNDKPVGLVLTNAYVHAVNTVGANSQIFVQQGDLGVVLSTTSVPEGVEAGKQVSGTATGTYKITNGRPQISSFAFQSAFSVGEGTRPAPIAITETTADLVSTHLLGLVKLEGVYAQSDANNIIVVNSNAEGTGTSMNVYDFFNKVSTIPASDVKCNVIGLFNERKDGSDPIVYSIMPVLDNDFDVVEKQNATLPTVSPLGSMVEAEPTKVASGETVTIAPAAGFTTSYTVNSGEKQTITAQSVPVTITESKTTIVVEATRPYYNDASATYYYEIDPGLTKYHITLPSVQTYYKIVSDVTDQKAGETVTLTISNITEHWNITGVTVEKADDETTTVEVANPETNIYTFVMPAYAVNVKVGYQSDPTYKIDYLKGLSSGVTGDDITESKQYAGTELTLKECTWKAAGYTFKNWYAYYLDDESQEVAITITDNKIIVPAHNVKIKAMWDEAAWHKDGTWELVTKTSELGVGDYVIFTETVNAGTENARYAGTSIVNTANKNLKTTTNISIDEEKRILTRTNNDATMIFQIETGNETNTYAFYADGIGYLNANGTGDNNYMITTESKASKNASWAIESIDATTGEASVRAKSSNRNLMQTNGNIFAAYGSKQKGLAIYKFYPKAWTVTFDDNVEDEEIAVPKMQRADPTTNKVTISTDVPVRTGYDFSIWNSAKDGTGVTSANPGDEITLSANKTLYAQWSIKQYNVAVAEVENVTIQAKPHSEDVIAEGANADVNFKKSVVLTYSELNEDYVFKSWKVTKADDETTEVPVSVGSSTTFEVPAYAVTVSAIIESKATTQLTVTYHANGGKNKTAGDPEEVSEQVNWNTTIKFAEHPCPFEKNLCTFVGWNTKDDGTGTTYKTQVTVKSDIDLYAMWEASAVEYVLDALNETTKVKLQEGVAPTGSTAAYTTDYSTLGQLTSGKYGTLTLTGYADKVITGVKMQMHSNKSSGAGTIVVKVGDKEICSTNYKESFGEYDQTTNWRIADLANFKAAIVGENENITIVVTASDNSLYINGYTIEYEDAPTATVIRGNLTPNQYTTYCEPQKVFAGTYTGATFWNIAEKEYMSDGIRLYSITIEQHLGDLEAGVPYIMLPEATELKGIKYGDAVQEPVAEGNNGLYGTFVDYAFDENEATARDAQQLYVISNGTLYLCGTGCGVYAYRAYIKSDMINYVAPSGAPRRTIGRPNVAPTILENVFGNQPAGKVQKVFIDGQIYIIRDTKVFNAQGQLVK